MSDQPESTNKRKSAATRIAEIADDLYEFCTAGQRCMARPKGDRGRILSLDEVRGALALEYQVKCDRVPTASELAAAMVVLTAKARANLVDDVMSDGEQSLRSHGLGPESAGLDEHPDRLKVHAGNRNPFDVAREVADFLIKRNEPPHLFAMGPAAAVVLREDGTLDALDQDDWLAYVAERVDFKSRTQDGERIVAPPSAVMKILAPIIHRDLPQLDGVTRTPYLDASGDLVAKDGYHPESRLVLRMEGLTLPPVGDAPSDDEVRAAADLLTKDWLGDFPFASDADKANVVAELLTLTGREMFPLAPLFVHDASTSGSGKGLLLVTLSIIATGAPPEVMELPGDGDEQRKTVTSVLLSGKLLVAWDELHVIAGRTLAAILTAEVYSGRILGVNKLATVRNKLVQIALGNNVEVRGDMKRRVVPTRLVPKVEHPEHRTDFAHADLQGWVRAHRGELLGAAFTIWRNWIAKGRKPADITMGSFERWIRTVGGALQCAGITGFHASTSEWLSYSEDDDGWPDHLAQLRRQYEDRWFTVSMVADAVGAGLIKRPPVKRDPDKELASQLAYAYRGQRERLHRGLRLIRSKKRDAASGGHTWSVRHSGESESDAAQDEPDPSSGSSVWSETPGQAQVSSPENADEATDYPQRGPDYLQNEQIGKVAGQPAFTEDTDHPGDQAVRHGADSLHADDGCCPDCHEPYESPFHAIECLGQEPPT